MPDWSWIPITLFAVAMQTVRTAGQKQLTAYFDAVTVTLVRFLFGLPFVLLYLLLVAGLSKHPLPTPSAVFIGFALLAAVSQIAATVFLVQLFSLRNFAVGTTYARTEAFLTAVVGTLLFGELIAVGAWLAIVVSVAGVVVLTVARSGLADGPWWARLWNRSAALGLASGLGFALASLALRSASLSFGIDAPLLTAGLTLVTVVALQTAMMVTYTLVSSPGTLPALLRHWRLALFVGLTSALGSAGWFLAMTLERAAYVKALGQIEFLLALGVSRLFFRETVSGLELLGMLLVAAGILVLIAVA